MRNKTSVNNLAEVPVAKYLCMFAVAVLAGLSSMYAVLAPFGLLFLVPVLVGIQNVRSARWVAGAGSMVGLGYALPLLVPLVALDGWSWSGHVFSFSSNPVIAWILVIIAALVLLGGGGAVLALLCIRWLFVRSAPIVLAAPLVWILMEWMRAWLVGGLTWGHLGYTQTFVPPLAGWASVGTVYLVSGLVVGTAALLAELLTRSWRGRAAASILLILLIFSTGTFLYSSFEHKTTNILSIHVPYTTTEATRQHTYNALLAEVENALRQGPELLILPENIFPFFIIGESDGLPYGYHNEYGSVRGNYDRLLELSRQYPDPALLLGMHTGNETGKYNSLYALHNGELTARYDKRHLLPFGEARVPLIARGDSTYVPGVVQQTFAVKGRTILPLICSEAYYMPDSQGDVDLVVHVANETIFRSDLVARYGAVMATMRALEMRAPLVRATKRHE